MSRSARIKALLVIDVIFFFVELISGYAVGSLALVADSFHMLNDVMSLIVALYAIKLTEQNSSDSRYSYGWHRAEILAALVNGVFLLALCFSISLEALERLINTPDISNPRLVVIVGTFGLASNLVGLFLFREHGHSHSHSHTETVKAPSGSAITSDSTIQGRKDSNHVNGSDSDSESSDALSGHPVVTRDKIVKAALDIARTRSRSPGREHTHNGDGPSTEETPLLAATSHNHASNGHSHHGHSHAGSMNMRALVLHVLGDALGNVGVIAAGLIIWQTNWSFRFYCDPIISLIITVIIFSSALPLVRSASFVLLQGVPPTISLDQVRSAILDVDGVHSVHELHIWQLSESKNIASVHVHASRDKDFMPIAANIRKALHHHGIHSSTIQPEYHHIGPPEQGQYADVSCLIGCPPDQECNPQDNSCCPPPSAGV